MRQTWRWFGPKDLVSIDDMLQAGVEGVVTALHHVPTGAVWTPEEIAERQAALAAMCDGAPSGLIWRRSKACPFPRTSSARPAAGRRTSKHGKLRCATFTRRGPRLSAITSCRSSTGRGRILPTACRTAPPACGSTRSILPLSTCFFWSVGAPPRALLPRSSRRRASLAEMTGARKEQLVGKVVFGLPGAARRMSMQDVKDHLAHYSELPAERLHGHLVDFLSEVAPLAQDLGVRLCRHPDDPPFPLLGLPRILYTEADYSAVMQAVDIPANGITLCTGSLGVRSDNDLPGMMPRLGDRVHFLHLRNVALEDGALGGSFHEAAHLKGDTEMVSMIAAILSEEDRRRAVGRADWHIPMRPDHGQDILDDQSRKAQPGYPAIGRLKGLAELRGIMTALAHPIVRAAR